MNILIVDSNRKSAKEIEDAIQRERFQIETFFLASTLTEAKDLLTGQEIAFVLSEVSFSDGCGEDLAVWMNQNVPKVSLIYVTEDKSFERARNAINLGVKGYLNKPIEKNLLNLTIEQTIAANNPALRQEFWQNIVYNECYITPHLLRRFGITEKDASSITPVLFCWNIKPRYIELLEDSLVNFTIRNIATEILLDGDHTNDLVITGNYLLIFCTGSRSAQGTMETLSEKCRLVLEKCAAFLEICSLSCYLTDTVPLEKLYECTKRLYRFESQDICKKNQVVNIDHLPGRKAVYKRPAVELMVQKLFSENDKECFSDIFHYLESINTYAANAQKILRAFHADIIQELSRVLYIRNIDARIVLADDALNDLLHVPTSSIEHMKSWFRKLYSAIQQNSRHRSNLPHFAVVEKVKDYIAKNLTLEINRNDLAALVYMHPDTLSHIFKVQTGTSISDYILQERLKAAKIMLITTKKKISEIAIDMGYDSAAYFIRIFKKNLGITPREYRQQSLEKIS